MRNVVQLCMAANNILLMRKWNHAFLLPVITRAWKMSDRFQSMSLFIENKLGDRMIKRLLNSVIANIVVFQCVADQLFASAFVFGK